MRQVSSRLKYIVAGNGNRRTRLHTQRGDRIRLTELGSAAVSVARRSRRRNAPGPWMVEDAVVELDRILRATDHLLELGSGTSTVWYAQRVAHVVSVEPDAAWHAKSAGLVARSSATNVDLKYAEIQAALVELIDSGARFDVVIVDSSDTSTWTRLDGARAAARLVRDDGLVVLDDSDRPRYAAVDGVFEGWPRKRFRGVKSNPLEYVETTLYSRR